MKLNLQSWIAAILALVLNIVVTTALLWVQLPGIMPKAKPLPPDMRTPGLFWDFYVPELDRVMTHLKTARLEFDKKAAMVDNDQARVNAEKEELAKLKAEIIRYRQELTDRILDVKASEQRNLKSLAVTYAAIEPDSVVKIFNEMDDALVAKIMIFMPPDTAGPIFQAMATAKDKNGNPLADRAARLSEYLRLSQTKEKTKTE
ncbi:MAG: hypothetical protein A2Y14_05465 [Verrucomicrobia bacterium GWF2_51_19]|nr:MAG: hypothetical protein A2Y14_05465 [Verrucomicrobia bacterium GWF2_51_19]HCJ12458.1 hypothetical protein [Opitutae bacterium]